MKLFVVFFLVLSAFSLLVTGYRRSSSPIEFGRTDEADESSLEDDEAGSAKSKHGMKVDIKSKGEGSFHIKVKQQEKTKTKSGVKEVTKITDTKKVKGGNVTSSSFEIIRYPNGTEVVKGKPPKGKKCSTDKECGANKFCGWFSLCQDCKKLEGFCGHDSHCCTADSSFCILGQCKKVDRSGKAGSYCRKDSECNKNLCCAGVMFGASECRPLEEEGQVCANMFTLPFMEVFGKKSKSAFCPCMEGLECRKRSESLLHSFNKLCLKKEKEEKKEEQKSDESEFDFFNYE